MSPRLSDSYVPATLIILDTSCVFTKSAATIVRRDIQDLITLTRDVSGISWLMPAIVFHERVSQMFAKAMEEVPAIVRLEAILGEPLTVRSQVTRERFVQMAETQLSNAGIRVIDLKYDAVDWQSTMIAAAYREPPFSPGEGEKGFKDALVLWTVRQAAETMAKRDVIVFVSSDALLFDTTLAVLPSLVGVGSIGELSEYLIKRKASLEEETNRQVALFYHLLDTDAATHLAAGSEVVERITTVVQELSASFGESAEHITSLVNTPNALTKTALAAAASETVEAGRKAANRLEAELAGFQMHFRSAIGAIARAATLPLAFDEDELDRLTEEVSSFGNFLAALAWSGEALTRLQAALVNASDRGAFELPEFQIALTELSAEYSTLLNNGRQAFNALKAWLGLADEKDQDSALS